MSKIKFLFNEREIFVGNYSFTFVKELFDLSRSDLLDCSSNQDCSVRMTAETADKILDLLAEEYENATAVKIYKTRPKPSSGWEATDPARNAKQARSFVKGGYAGLDTKIVQTGKRGDIFPYTIYTKQRKR
jgi:hypothetical protein